MEIVNQTVYVLGGGGSKSIEMLALAPGSHWQIVDATFPTAFDSVISLVEIENKGTCLMRMDWKKHQYTFLAEALK